VSLLAGSPNGDRGYRDGAAASALFNGPYSLTWTQDKVTSKPVLYVADSANHAIRRINLATNTVSTVWGTPTVVDAIRAKGLTLWDRVRRWWWMPHTAAFGGLI
jgi:hypothetical protein